MSIVDWVSVYIATYVYTPIVSIQSPIEKQLNYSLKTNNQYREINTYVASIIRGEDIVFSLLKNNRSKCWIDTEKLHKHYYVNFYM